MRSRASATLSKDMFASQRRDYTPPAASRHPPHFRRRWGGLGKGLPRFCALCFHYIRQTFNAREHTAELCEIANFHDKFQVGDAAVEVHGNIRDVYAFVLEQCGNISHQALAIISLDHDVHGESAFGIPPAYLQESLCILAA